MAFILFGFGAITYAKHPEGIIEAQTAASVNAICAGRAAPAAGRTDGTARPLRPGQVTVTDGSTPGPGDSAPVGAPTACPARPSRHRDGAG